MNENQGMQKRMLLFTVIVFVLFIVYEFTVLKPQQQEREAQAALEQKKANLAPKQDQASSNALNTASSAAISPLSAKTVSSKNIIARIKTSKNIIEIDNLGRLAQVTLSEAKYKNEEGEQIKLFNISHLRALEVRFSNADVNDEAFKVSMTSSAKDLDASKSKQTLVLTQKLSTTTLVKTFTFYPAGHYSLNVKSTNKEAFFITNGARPSVATANVGEMVAKGVLLKLNDDTLTIIEDEDLDKNENFTGVKIVSNFDKYYTTLVYNFDKSLAVTLMPDEENNPQAFIHGNDNISFGGYVGPKEHIVLKAINPSLVDVVEYGWFTFIAKPMFSFLNFIHSYVGNWGWSIVLLTISIKLILFPLSYKGMMSMQKMKDLAPKMKEIQAKYKDDKQKQSMHMMELYKKHGANPMGGCLPLVLQIPVFFSIYRVLLNSIELKGAEWILWIHDLALMDPYYVLPILMGVSMFLQQKITPTTMQDEMQKKIFQFLPVVFTFFFLWFPAGLTLYWFINNVFTIAQQFYINKVFEKKRALQK